MGSISDLVSSFSIFFSSIFTIFENFFKLFFNDLPPFFGIRLGWWFLGLWAILTIFNKVFE